MTLNCVSLVCSVSTGALLGAWGLQGGHPAPGGGGPAQQCGSSDPQGRRGDAGQGTGVGGLPGDSPQAQPLSVAQRQRRRRGSRSKEDGEMGRAWGPGGAASGPDPCGTRCFSLRLGPPSYSVRMPALWGQAQPPHPGDPI